MFGADKGMANRLDGKAGADALITALPKVLGQGPEAVQLAALDASEERDNTLIVLSGDHGAPGFPYGKNNPYDFGSGVPLLVSGPGVARGDCRRAGRPGARAPGGLHPG